MKSLLRRIVFTAISLFGISFLFPQVSFVNWTVLLMTAIVLVLLTTFVKPLLKIVFLPVNIITFGLFAWVINLVVLYLAILLVPGFQIEAISVPAFELGPLVFPAFHLTRFWSFFLVSFLVALGNGFLGWLL